MRLRGAAVLITGASSGIGAATALAFARRRSRLALCARRRERLDAVARRCRALGAPDVVALQTDIGREDQARGFVDVALQRFERVDVLVNNAGVGWRGRLADLTGEELSQLFATNVLGTTWTTQAVLPGMVAANRGVIVNVASVVGFRAMPYSAAYSASKHAVVGLSHGLRGELSGTGVKVCVVYPGTTETEFLRGRQPGRAFRHSADWVARAIVRTARWPRRDVVILPYRLAWLAEPFLGGFLDHALGEARRSQRRTAP